MEKSMTFKTVYYDILQENVLHLSYTVPNGMNICM
jgi:hypothetical protein